MFPLRCCSRQLLSSHSRHSVAYSHFRFFCSGSNEHTKLDGFNQVLRISFPVNPAASDIFERVVTKFALICLRHESKHLQKFDIMKHNKSDNFIVFQTYNSKEGFLAHRISPHFAEFMKASAPFMASDVDLQEYKSLSPSQDEWRHCGVDGNTGSREDQGGAGWSSLQVSLTALEGKEEELAAATIRHCQESTRYFSRSAEGREKDAPSIRLCLMQSTRDPGRLELVISVLKTNQEDMLARLKNSPSYLRWAECTQPLLASPRTSTRCENITFSL